MMEFLSFANLNNFVIIYWCSQLTSREEAAFNYNSKLKERFQHHPQIRRINRWVNEYYVWPCFCLKELCHGNFNRELKQSRRRRQQKPHKFAYLTMENSIFARFARAYFIFWHFEDVLVLSTTWNDLFCSCVDDVSIWWQMFNFVLCPKRLFQFNSRTVKTHFSSITTLNN